MSTGTPKTTFQPLSAFALAVIAAASWAGWLGWDQHRDVHPDGSTTGPYEAWQVIGLVLTLLVAVYWAASRGRVTAAVTGISVGLTAAAGYDWSDDSSGLFAVGVTLILIGSLFVTTAVSLAVAALHGHLGDRNRGGGRTGA
ncbi:hypothetical protein OG206_22935 [Streptomyces sp. NBC_01341]|uniref:hypothetical protein n=1 Tax=Streptomyces sp. NBC_01341 TaxID=2903831 RepID=UPI002E150ABF|nr:hypothetical protein OG206_22935 [Streptomyces sp. NBC_01341]